MFRSLAILLGVLTLLVFGVSSAQAEAPIEGVWTFEDGKVEVVPGPDGTFSGIVVAPTSFSRCSHEVGEVIWSGITVRADGSYWGFHQWFTSGCAPVSTLGLSAWRVRENGAGITGLIFCTSEPGRKSQPEISPDGATSGATECHELAPIPDTAIVSGPSGATASAAATFAFSSTQPGSFECRLDSAPAWSSCTSPVTYPGLDDGQHSFEVRAKDVHGNADPSPAAASWSVDTEAPDTTITSGPTGPTASDSASFAFTATEDASFECRLDSSSDDDWSSCVSPQAYGSLADGAHSFEVRAKDTVGNTDPTPASASFSVDTKAPNTSITSGPGSVITSNSATFAFTATEADSYECRLDGAATWSACESPTTYTGLADGPHKFEVRAKDALGNTDATPAATSFSVDTQPPETTIISFPSGPISSNLATATFTFASSAPGGSFQCRLDSGPWTPCTSPASYGGLTPGTHVFEVRAVDGLGIVDPSSASVLFKVDPPINGERVAVAPLKGKVRIRIPGDTRFRPLTATETIPVGSAIDTTEGKVLLTSANASGEEQSAAFFEGIFRVGQALGRKLVTLKLRSGDLGDCGTPEAASASASRGRGGHLWGSGHGSFRTEGNNGSATVSGTIWFTEDRCEGTFFKVRRGLVAIRDYALGKTVMLPAGNSYLARADAGG